MKRVQALAVLFSLSFLLTCAGAFAAEDAVYSGPTPRFFIADGDLLAQVRALVNSGEAGGTVFCGALAGVRRDADDALDAGPFSVTFKTGIPPSGDKHDYMSVGPYWWPNPEADDGLPYIRRDGDVNPEYREGAFDATARSAFNRAWRDLALAAYFTGEDAYARHAAHLLRVWFLDPDTRMNPNMRYAQAIPGRTDGRAVGIVEAEGLRYLPDAVGMLAFSGHWTEQDERGMQQWCREFLDWMLNSGALETYLARGGHNNIAIGLDSLIVSLALYTRQPALAREQIMRLSRERIGTQIESDGRMPLELARTRAYGYSMKALTSFFVVARLAEHLDIDLWNYTTDDGRSLRSALDFLIPYVYEPKAFEYEGTVNARQLGRTLLPLAIRAWKDDNHRKAYERLGDSVSDYQELLLYPLFLLQE